MSGRIMGVDYGGKRTGIAVSDEAGFLASACGTVKAEGLRSLTAQLADKAAELGVKSIVVGNPINMNGTRGESSERAVKLAGMLREATGLPVELYDERRTTMAATVFLNATDTRGSKRKAVVDTLSAEIILQDYLDSLRNRAERERAEAAPDGEEQI